MHSARARVSRVPQDRGHIMRRLSTHSLLHTTAAAAVFAAALGAAPAFAQEPADSEPSDIIIVTGTRIVSPNLESAIPVTSVGGDQFFQTGKISVGDILNELPAMRSSFNMQNSTRFLGTAGLSLLDLRGLDTMRTLVLQNGRRHVGSNLLGDGVSVDVNTIPTDLIERVDVVTGGNSAIYGSDAIAGVVNFVLKDNYEGISLRGQGGISSRGDAGAYYVSALAGTNFADDRGNIAVNFEYARQNDYYAPSRPTTRISSGYLQVDSDPGDAVNGSDGIPDRIFIRDARYGYYDNGGTYVTFQGGDFLTPYIFQRDGTLVPQTGQLTDVIASSPFPIFSGGNGSTAREGRQFGLSPRVDRYSANLIAHFEVSPAFVPFVEAKYVRTDSLSNASGPFFTSAVGNPRETFYTTNPFLTDQARELIRSTYGDYYDANGDANSDGIPDSDQFGFPYFRSVTDLGNREEKAKRETYRIVGGIRGQFGSASNWKYEASVNYGQFKESTLVLGNTNLQRYLLAIDAVRDPVSGNIVCRSKIDPSAAVAYEFAEDPDFAAARLAQDVAACVPANLFGEGNLSQAARDYINQDTISRGKITQLVAGGYVSGNTAGFLELPGGPIGIAVGVEYRRETMKYRQDDLVSNGMTFYNAIPTFDPPSFEVKELYGELRIPVLRDLPFAHELTFDVAGRLSDYKGATGTVFAWNAGIEYAPVPDIKIRANYSRSIRAPNLSDLYTPPGVNYALIDDPCAQVNIGGGSSNRAANCAAAGVPGDYNYIYTDSLQFRSGGNPGLKEEYSDSYTVGVIVQPRFMPRFSFSADYFDITVNDVITSPGAQQILDACYDGANLDNQFCGLFERVGAGGGPRGEAPYSIREDSLRAVLLNYAKLKVRGIDAQMAYNTSLFDWGQIQTKLNYTHVFQNDEFLFPDDPGRADQRLLELNYPRDAFTWDVSLKRGKVTLGYQMRYIGKAVLNDYEDTYSKQGRPPQNADYAVDRFYSDAFYHDIRFEFAPDDTYSFYFGVDNVGDRLPTRGLSGIGDGSGIYDVRGRYLYAGAVAKF